MYKLWLLICTSWHVIPSFMFPHANLFVPNVKIEYDFVQYKMCQVSCNVAVTFVENSVETVFCEFIARSGDNI